MLRWDFSLPDVSDASVPIGRLGARPSNYVIAISMADYPSDKGYFKLPPTAVELAGLRQISLLQKQYVETVQFF